ncbi:MAG: hypothetical protein ACJAS4_003841 [Bacteriovoracaceae bacterium]|jgi:hypothetical protein
MKTLLIGLTLLSMSAFANETDSKIFKNPKTKLTFISGWGYKLTESAAFTCDSDLDLVCQKINPKYSRARDYECSIMKMNTFKNLVSSSLSYVGNGIDKGLLALSNIGCEEENNCSQRQWVAEPGEAVVLYNLQERNANKIENMQKYPYSLKNGKTGDISIESLRNSYYENAYAENEVEHLSKIECLKD